MAAATTTMGLEEALSSVIGWHDDFSKIDLSVTNVTLMFALEDIKSTLFLCSLTAVFDGVWEAYVTQKPLVMRRSLRADFITFIRKLTKGAPATSSYTEGERLVIQELQGLLVIGLTGLSLVTTTTGSGSSATTIGEGKEEAKEKKDVVVGSGSGFGLSQRRFVAARLFVEQIMEATATKGALGRVGEWELSAEQVHAVRAITPSVLMEAIRAAWYPLAMHAEAAGIIFSGSRCTGTTIIYSSPLMIEVDIRLDPWWSAADESTRLRESERERQCLAASKKRLRDLEFEKEEEALRLKHMRVGPSDFRRQQQQQAETHRFHEEQQRHNAQRHVDRPVVIPPPFPPIINIKMVDSLTPFIQTSIRFCSTIHIPDV
jgi:hypothetical protein